MLPEAGRIFQKVSLLPNLIEEIAIELTFEDYFPVAAAAGRMRKVAESEADLMSADRSRFGIERR